MDMSIFFHTDQLEPMNFSLTLLSDTYYAQLKSVITGQLDATTIEKNQNSGSNSNYSLSCIRCEVVDIVSLATNVIITVLVYSFTSVLVGQNLSVMLPSLALQEVRCAGKEFVKVQSAFDAGKTITVALVSYVMTLE